MILLASLLALVIAAAINACIAAATQFAIDGIWHEHVSFWPLFVLITVVSVLLNSFLSRAKA